MEKIAIFTYSEPYAIASAFDEWIRIHSTVNIIYRQLITTVVDRMIQYDYIVIYKE